MIRSCWHHVWQRWRRGLQTVRSSKLLSLFSLFSLVSVIVATSNFALCLLDLSFSHRAHFPSRATLCASSLCLAACIWVLDDFYAFLLLEYPPSGRDDSDEYLCRNLALCERLR